MPYQGGDRSCALGWFDSIKVSLVGGHETSCDTCQSLETIQALMYLALFDLEYPSVLPFCCERETTALFKVLSRFVNPS